MKGYITELKGWQMNEKLKAWRQKRQESMVLPSGLEVTLRKVDLMDLVAGGQIPAPLLSQIEGLSDLSEADAADNTKMLEKLPEYIDAINALVMGCVIDPPMAAHGDDDHLGVDELSLDDKMTIFEWASSGTAALEKFRAEPGADGDPARDGQGLRPAAEQPGGDR